MPETGQAGGVRSVAQNYTVWNHTSATWEPSQNPRGHISTLRMFLIPQGPRFCCALRLPTAKYSPIKWTFSAVN